MNLKDSKTIKEWQHALYACWHPYYFWCSKSLHVVQHVYVPGSSVPYLLTYLRIVASSQSEQSTILLTLYNCIIAFSSYVILLLYKHISFRFFCTFCIFCFVFAADFIGEWKTENAGIEFAV